MVLRIAGATLALGFLGVASLSAADPVSFTKQVMPIFAERCLACHSHEERFGGLSLDAYEDVTDYITPGKPDESRLVIVVSGAKAKMPRGGPPLKAERIEILRTWIEQGAKNDTPAAKPAGEGK